jgi:hypothetical protein
LPHLHRFYKVESSEHLQAVSLYPADINTVYDVPVNKVSIKHQYETKSSFFYIERQGKVQKYKFVHLYIHGIWKERKEFRVPGVGIKVALLCLFFVLLHIFTRCMYNILGMQIETKYIYHICIFSCYIVYNR